MERITRQEAEERERAVKDTLEAMHRDFDKQPLTDDEIEEVEDTVFGKLYGRDKIKDPYEG